MLPIFPEVEHPESIDNLNIRLNQLALDLKIEKSETTKTE